MVLLVVATVLTTLKLSGVINLSWMLVLAPITFPLIVVTALKAIGVKF